MLDTLALVVGERAFAKLEPALMLLDLVVEVRRRTSSASSATTEVATARSVAATDPDPAMRPRLPSHRHDDLVLWQHGVAGPPE